MDHEAAHGPASGPRGTRLAFGAVDLVSAALVLFGVFVALPSRFWPVDVVAALVAASLGGAGVGLVANKPWGRPVARIASFAVLGVGLALVAALALTASYLSGIYGPVGRGGAVILVLVAALALPYLIVLPAVQLVWLGRKP